MTTKSRLVRAVQERIRGLRVARLIDLPWHRAVRLTHEERFRCRRHDMRQRQLQTECRGEPSGQPDGLRVGLVAHAAEHGALLSES
jgi:hypothetical protein